MWNVFVYTSYDFFANYSESKIRFDGDVLYSIRFLNTLIKENNKAYCVKHSRQIIKMAKSKHTSNGNIVFVNCEYVHYELAFVNVSK